jgi:hypothetical protein
VLSATDISGWTKTNDGSLNGETVPGDGVIQRWKLKDSGLDLGGREQARIYNSISRG